MAKKEAKTAGSGDACRTCYGTGTDDSGNNELPCEDCPAGASAMFNDMGTRKTGMRWFQDHGRPLPAAWRTGALPAARCTDALAAPASTTDLDAVKQELAVARGEVAALKTAVESLAAVVAENLKAVQGIQGSVSNIYGEIKSRNVSDRLRGATLDSDGNVVLEAGEAGGIFGGRG